MYMIIIKKASIFTTIAIAILFFSCTSNSSQQDIETEAYVSSIFQRDDKSTYVCDIPVIVTLNGDCGFIQVPVDYTQPHKDTYYIFWFFLPAEIQSVTTKTIVPLVGGPGGAISGELEIFIENSNFDSLRKHNNILSFDYRGLGLSEPYDPRTLDYCDRESDYDSSILLAMKECQRILQENNISYKGITTANFIQDLDRILTYRAIDTVILYGISYGTRVALTGARDIPHRVTGMVLDGVFPIEVNGFDQGSEAPLFNISYLIQSFREHKDTLPHYFGNIEQRITQVASDALQHNAQDIAFTVLTTLSKYAYDPHRFVIAHILLEAYEQQDEDAFDEAMYTIEEKMYTEESPPYFEIIDKKSRAVFSHRPTGTYMSASIIASEEYNAPFKSNIPEIKNVDPIVLELFKEFSGSAPISKEEVGEIKHILQITQADAIEFKAVVSDIPTLLFSARRDMQTSPRWGSIVAGTMSNTQHFIFTDEDHALTFSNACSLTLFEKFAQDPQSVTTLYDPCIEKATAINTPINNTL